MTKPFRKMSTKVGSVEARLWGVDADGNIVPVKIDEDGRLKVDIEEVKIEGDVNVENITLKGIVKTLQDGVSENQDGEELDVSGYGTVIFDINPSEGAGNDFNGLVNFEGTVDGTNWRKLFAFNKDQSYWTNDAGTSGVYVADIKGYAKVRGRITDRTEGSVTVVARATQQGDTRMVRVSEGSIDAFSSSTIIDREGETTIICTDTDISGEGIQQFIKNFINWTIYFKANDAVEITVELSPDEGTTWFEMPGTFSIPGGGGSDWINGQYLVVNAIKLSANNTEGVTAILRGIY